MSYVITNGVNYIKMTQENRPTTTGNIKDARIFDDRVKAQNYCVCLPNTLKRFGFYVSEVEASAPPAPPKRFENPISHDVFQPAQELDERALNIEYIVSEVKRFENFVEFMRSQTEPIRQQFAYAEAQIFDIEHAAELSNLNVCQGFRVYKALHEARVLRRQCKDALDLISQIENAISAGMITKNVSKHFDRMEARTFTPRAIPDLFDTIRGV